MVKPPPPPPSRVPVNVQRAEKTWVDVLKEVGYPTDVVVADVESYFDETYSLKSLTIPEYISGKKWEVLGIAHAHVDGRNPHVNPDAVSAFEVGEAAVASYLKYLQTSYGPALAGCTVVMHNSSFDAMVLAMRYGIHPKYIIDTVNLGRSFHTRSKHGLADLCKKFSLKDKGETKDFLGCTLRTGRYVMSKGRGKHKKPPSPRPVMTDDQVKALSDYACNDAAREFELFAVLLPKLSNPKVELAIQDATLRMVTQPVLQCDYERGMDLINKMELKVVETCAAVGHDADTIRGEIEFERLLTEALEAAGDRPQAYMKVMKKGWKFELAKDDAGLKLLQNHPSPRVQQLVKARSALKSWPLHIARVERIMRMAEACKGLMPVPLNYHGGHTGRDSGAWGINAQNLPKRGEPEVVAMRGLLIAPPDQELVIVDLAAVEARVLAWVAGQEDLVEKFSRNEEIYCGFASKVLGKPSWKPKKTDPPAVHKIMTERRNLGKVGILGCGYGMGKDRLQEYAAGPFYNLTLSTDEAQAVVDTYRNTNTSITGFWRAIEKAFIYTAKYKRPCGMDRGVSFYSTDDVDVVMVLPNRRVMNYHQVKLTPGQYSDTAAVYNEVEHCWNHLWGGVLTENCLAGGTPVLTHRGWVAIEHVRATDKIWDGICFVGHRGVVYRGRQQTVRVEGIVLTPDHLVLTMKGWQYAAQAQGLGWAPCGRPACYRLRRALWWALAMARHLLGGTQSGDSVPGYSDSGWGMRGMSGCESGGDGKTLWDMGRDQDPVLQPKRGVLAQLWGAGHSYVRCVARVFRRLLGGYEGRLRPTSDHRPGRCKRSVQQSQLPLGDLPAANGAQAGSEAEGNVPANRRSAGPWVACDIQPPLPGSVVDVYDLMDCGPRMRFVVAGGRIVHNCVQAISRDILMEASLRLNALGYRTVHRVHDELIISVPKGEGKNLVREENKVWKGIAIEELSRVPAWAPGMPLGAEGIVSERYGLH